MDPPRFAADASDSADAMLRGGLIDAHNGNWSAVIAFALDEIERQVAAEAERPIDAIARVAGEALAQLAGRPARCPRPFAQQILLWFRETPIDRARRLAASAIADEAVALRRLD